MSRQVLYCKQVQYYLIESSDRKTETTHNLSYELSHSFPFGINFVMLPVSLYQLQNKLAGFANIVKWEYSSTL